MYIIYSKTVYNLTKYNESIKCNKKLKLNWYIFN